MTALDRPRNTFSTARWYRILAVLVFALGGAIVPVIGWLVGLVMVWLSPVWTRREKWWATGVAPIVTIVVFIVAVILHGAGVDEAPLAVVVAVVPIVANLVVSVGLWRRTGVIVPPEEPERR